MKIALFAADVVGKEIAKFFGDNHESLECLVLDSGDAKGLKSEIIKNSGFKNIDRIFRGDSIYEEQSLIALKNLDLDLIILAWWPYIIKSNLIKIPRLGCLNCHPSFLPYNRGKHYNFWTIIEDVPFGVSIHWVSEKVDSGDIAFQSKIEKTWEDTGETLYYKAQKEIVRLFKEKFPEIKRGDIPRKLQDLNLGSFHKSDEIDNTSKIDLDKEYKGRKLLNLLRARTFPPYPGAWFIDNGNRYEIRVKITKVNEKMRRNNDKV